MKLKVDFDRRETHKMFIVIDNKIYKMNADDTVTFFGFVLNHKKDETTNAIISLLDIGYEGFLVGKYKMLSSDSVFFYYFENHHLEKLKAATKPQARKILNSMEPQGLNWHMLELDVLQKWILDNNLLTEYKK